MITDLPCLLKVFEQNDFVYMRVFVHIDFDTFVYGDGTLKVRDMKTGEELSIVRGSIVDYAYDFECDSDLWNEFNLFG
jgi:hypothetical protein